ncbi:uncharacterized protein LOC111023611 [Momordica charantia]|uniref:Uncharacterized protein LOC111023611 n=1 Tax=Momordica charantia TaxID=3673 RepID=A0A6J1DRA8_MOMCH|nr:uncharacterized protein LOC111023611 [Momordica charantia]
MTHAFKISQKDRFLGLVTSLCHLSNVNKHIKQKLTPEQLDMFMKETIFGRFVDLDMMFYSPLVHYFLLRKVIDALIDSMCFSIGGTTITVSKAEFLSMTQLWRPSGRVFQKKDFEQLYKDTFFDNNEDAAKVTLVYCTEFGMMVKKYKVKSNVNDDPYGDIDDLDHFSHIDLGDNYME